MTCRYCNLKDGARHLTFTQSIFWRCQGVPMVTKISFACLHASLAAAGPPKASIGGAPTDLRTFVIMPPSSTPQKSWNHISVPGKRPDPACARARSLLFIAQSPKYQSLPESPVRQGIHPHAGKLNQWRQRRLLLCTCCTWSNYRQAPLYKMKRPLNIRLRLTTSALLPHSNRYSKRLRDLSQDGKFFPHSRQTADIVLEEF